MHVFVFFLFPHVTSQSRSHSYFYAGCLPTHGRTPRLKHPAATQQSMQLNCQTCSAGSTTAGSQREFLPDLGGQHVDKRQHLQQLLSAGKHCWDRPVIQFMRTGHRNLVDECLAQWRLLQCSALIATCHVVGWLTSPVDCWAVDSGSPVITQPARPR